MKRMLRVWVILALVMAAFPAMAEAAPANVGINIVLNQPVKTSILKDLGTLGKVRDVLPEIQGVTLFGPAANLPAIQAKPYVAKAALDGEVNIPPLDTVAAENFLDGMSTWDQDTINVTEFGAGRTMAYTGEGVYVAVLDTGLVSNWRMFFPEERVAEEYAVAFGGGGVSGNQISVQPGKWEQDADSHGTHVTSTIIGFDFFGAPVNGTAPLSTIIPVKVLNQNGSGHWSMITHGIVYVANLKAGPLAGSPVVINMSLGGGSDPLAEAAVNYAISKGVLVVASAGNNGDAGMGYPGAYPQVISAAAAGWERQWTASGWWRTLDVQDPTNTDDFFIADFSARELPGQDLDVAAPGDWIVGPYQANLGQPSYYYLSGTSMASPHVAGVLALMAQKNPALAQAQAESILESTALAMSPGCSTVVDPSVGPVEICWGANATGHGLLQADLAVAATPKWKP